MRVNLRCNATQSGGGRWLRLLGSRFRSGVVLANGLASASFCWLLFGCSTTVDSLGYDLYVAPRALQPVDCKSGVYPNAFKEILGKTDSEIQLKLSNAFATLFYGNTAMQRIYFTGTTAGTSYIYDTYHGDIRTEGMGLGMMAALMLGKQDEFDAMWRYASTVEERKSGPGSGYFDSFCNSPSNVPYSCVDPFGLEQFITALILATKRWPADATRPDYGSEALRLLTVMRSKIADNGGIVGGVTNSFDAREKLLYDDPTNGGMHYLRTGLAIPAYYELWAQVTGDTFYADAAVRGRSFLMTSPHPKTGLYPMAANFDGSPYDGLEDFAAASYRVHLNFLIDRHWGSLTGAAANWQVPIVDKMLKFFTSKGLTTYFASYTLDGRAVPINTNVHGVELTMANGVIASIATVANAKDFIQAAWDQQPPEGNARYYAGLFYLIGNLMLSGQYRLCP